MGVFRSSRALDAVAELTPVIAAAASDVDPSEASAAAGRTASTSLVELMLAAGSEQRVDRLVAHSVPAYRRARTLVASSIAQAQLKRKLANGRLVDGSPFMRQPDPKRTAFAFWFDIAGDLADYGVAYAVNTGRQFAYADAANPYLRKHVAVERVSPEDVTLRDNVYEVRLGPRIVDYAPEYVIAFECQAGDWLTGAARAVATSRLLEESARVYAETPQAATILSNTGPRKTPEQIEQLLAAWEAARRSRSTAYVGRDVTAEAVGFDAQQIALVDARSAAVLDIARATGIPSLYLSQGPNDASMTYSNMTTQRLDLYAAFAPFATAIEARLSFDDVTGQGTAARFDFGPWLRVDPLARAELYSKLIPLGVMTTDEARAMEDLVPLATTPTEPTPATDPNGAGA